MRNNHPIPKNHFKKTAIKYKTWFHQLIQKKIRASKRATKAKSLYPMPLKKLRPIVRCPTLRYNSKERLGRGFTPEECDAAGIDYLKARTMGISVDIRRKNQNMETFNQNVERLKIYLGRLVIYKDRKEAKEANVKQHVKIIMPVVKKQPEVGSVRIDEIESKLWAWDKIEELKKEVKHVRVKTK